ncbi:hypothetical protein K438DRAFT_2007901 [Mycena galopus ATCC 62051]|nr:hypothetical protein K438DRAFT_2007901 [Mycena galopus ATCC 62051]
MYEGLTIQFTLARGRKLNWMNELRKGLYPGQIPVHVTVFPVFTLDDDEYFALFERLEEVAAQFEPWVLEECGTDQCNDWVAIRLCDEDGEDGFGEIVEELKDWVPVDAMEEPHITVYRGPKSGTYIPYFGQWMGTAGIRRRLERLVDEYTVEHGGNGLSVRVTGLQLLQDGEVVDRHPSMPSLITPTTNSARYVLGGWDLSICFALFLQGVVCSQFAHYMTLKKRDSLRMKLFVAGLAVLTTVKSMQCLAIIWKQTVEPFVDLEATWIANINIILEATVAFYVQIFFSHRLWALSRNPYLVITCLTLFVFGLISGALATFFIFTTSNMETITGWVSVHLGVVLCGDLLLTGSTIFWLLRHSSQSVLARGPTATILSALLHLTLQASPKSPPALCALVIFGVAVRLHIANGLVPILMMLNYMAIMVLPQLYAWSAMWTLNSRDKITSAAENAPYTVDLGTVDLGTDLATFVTVEPQHNIVCSPKANEHEHGRNEEVNLDSRSV